MSCKFFLCTFTLLVISLPAHADESANALLKGMEAAIASTQSMTMDIFGAVHDQRPNRTPLTTFTGQARMMRPNLARIDYQEVTQKSDGTELSKKRGVIAADGKFIWRYDPQKNEYRNHNVALDGSNISVADALPMDSMVYLFFHAHVPHTDAPPIYMGKEMWNGKSYRVIEFREASANSTDTPMIRQRFYIGSDNLIHRFVNEQLQGKYVSECTYENIRTKASTRLSNFVYAPPSGAKKYVDLPPPMLAAGTVAPDLTAEDRDGKPLRLSDMRGKVVVLDFWTTGCGHCIESRFHLNAVAKKFAGEVIVVALNVADTKEVFTDFLSKHPEYDTIQFALATSAADKERAMILYQVPGFPMEYVIGKDGKIVKGLLGYDGPTPDLEKAIIAAGGLAR